MIVVATTLHAYVTDSQDTSEAWLYNAEKIADSHPDGVVFFAAIELDGRGLAPFASLLRRLNTLALHPSVTGIDHWTFSFDDGATEIRTDNRLRRITMGQNMANDYAMSAGASHLLFCAADCAPAGDVLPKLLELDHPICGPEIPTYCLSGPVPEAEGLPEEPCPGKCQGRGVIYQGPMGYEMTCPECDGAGYVHGPMFPDFPVQEHMASAACILLGREVFRQLRWRSDGDMGMTDDPCLHHDALNLLGIPTYVRKDCVARHYPECIGSIEQRHPGNKRQIVREPEGDNHGT